MQRVESVYGVRMIVVGSLGAAVSLYLRAAAAQEAAKGRPRNRLEQSTQRSLDAWKPILITCIGLIAVGTLLCSASLLS